MIQENQFESSGLGADRFGLARGLINLYVKKTLEKPELAHLYALQAEQHLRRLIRHDVSLTFAANCYQVKIAEETKEESDYPAVSNTNRRIEKVSPQEIQNPFLHISIKRIQALNLEYANKVIENRVLWQYFLNKYLRQYDLEITSSGGESRFLSISSKSFAPTINLNIKVSVIMSAYRAEKTLYKSAYSILNQMHSNIELIIINDASDDKTGEVAETLKKYDRRVRVLHNPRAFGPYVSRNRALAVATGDYVTCHDADDIAMPSRIGRQLHSIVANDVTSSTCQMLRLTDKGAITRRSMRPDSSSDGYSRLCHISGMHNINFFRREIGSWDCVNFGADTELLHRIERTRSGKIFHLNSVEYLAMDHADSLTRSKDFGLFSQEGMAIRAEYKKNWTSWHLSNNDLYLNFPQTSRLFAAPEKMISNFTGI